MPALRRLAVVVPPASWLDGILRAYHDLYRQALAELGVETFSVPVQASLPLDTGHLADLTADLKAFRPQAAMALTIGSWLLSCRLATRRDGWRPNLFTDVLDIPAICLWDHAPLDFATDLLGDAPSTGAMATLRQALAHPRMIHWSRDSGQTRVMRELDFLPAGNVIAEISPALPGFAPDPGDTPAEDVAFIGHLNHHPRPWPDAAFAGLAGEIIDEARRAPDQPIWEILRRRTSPLGLDPDHSRFWSFAHRLVVYEAQAALRLATLRQAGVPLTVYGNLDPTRAPANLTARPGHIPFGQPLARTFARHAITVDVASPAFIDGFSHKPVLGFASGGFVLLNRKRDFVAAFGAEGEAVSYSTADELAGKIDLYLSKPRLRQEIGQAIRAKLLARHDLRATLERVLESAAQEIDNRGSPAAPAASAPSIPVLDLLPQLRRWGKWPWHPDRVRRRRHGVVVTCHAVDWGYAARVVLPEQVTRLREPHLVVTVETQAGRVGVGVLCDPFAPPILEQHVGPSRSPVDVVLELPPDAALEAIVRKTSDEPVRAVITRLVLCDRFPRLPTSVGNRKR